MAFGWLLTTPVLFPARGSHPRVKYQPYKSCSCRLCRAFKAGAWTAWRGRVRTRHGWAYKAHPDWSGSKPWKLRDTGQQNRAWKRDARRAFRRMARRAIYLELRVRREVSHRFYYGGAYLA